MERPTGFDIARLSENDVHVPSDYGLTPAQKPVFIQLASHADAFAESGLEIASPPTHAERQYERELSRSARIFDVALALAILAFVLPLMLFCTLAVVLSSRGPVLFRHTRIGRNGSEFTCLKFRTMHECAERSLDDVLNSSDSAREEWTEQHKVLADPRVTSVGRFLRRYSLDELPQLVNVLKGDMSVVGPRPIVAAEIHRYGPFFVDYCNVRPGLTGLWQVSGAHALSYSERVHLDAEYARSKSVALDLLILLRTIPVVLHGDNN